MCCVQQLVLPGSVYTYDIIVAVVYSIYTFLITICYRQLLFVNTVLVQLDWALLYLVVHAILAKVYCNLTINSSQASSDVAYWGTELPIIGIVLMDSEMSVAANVVLYLLLTSGDVETNPGPGGIQCMIRDGNIASHPSPVPAFQCCMLK